MMIQCVSMNIRRTSARSVNDKTGENDISKLSRENRFSSFSYIKSWNEEFLT